MNITEPAHAWRGCGLGTGGRTGPTSALAGVGLPEEEVACDLGLSRGRDHTGFREGMQGAEWALWGVMSQQWGQDTRSGAWQWG